MSDFQKDNLDIDTKLLADFIYALNIARRQVLSYPAGHPMVDKATDGLVAILPQLLEFRSSLTLGVARHDLMFDGEIIDSANPVFKDLAGSLFEMQIASLTINRELTHQEVVVFFNCFGMSADELQEQGGVASVLNNSGVRGFRVQGIDFKAFGTTVVDVVHAPETKALESDASLIWKAFANGMIRGSIDPNGEKFQSLEDLDPEMLVEVLNSEFDDDIGTTEASYEDAITSYLKQSDQDKIRGQVHQETMKQLGGFSSKLKPKVRRHFLNSMLKSCAGRPEAAEELLSHLPRTVLMDAFDQIEAGTIDIPKSLLDVVGQLSLHRGDEASSRRVAGENSRTAEETARQLTKLFKEDRSEFFVPRDYQDALAAVTSAKAELELEQPQIVELVSSLNTHAVENQFTSVLLDLFEKGVDPQVSDALGRNLLDMTEYFMNTGAFDPLSSIHMSLSRHVVSLGTEDTDSSHEALAKFSAPEFMQGVMDSIDLWGEPANEAINRLIEQIGAPFADILLDKLAEEPRMSRRRQLMKLLISMGAPVVAAIASKLDDRRWYFVRNMVLVLREVNGPDALDVLQNLKTHKHPKVKLEVIKTLALAGGDQGSRTLFKALADKDPVLLSGAVQMAAGSNDHRVLLAMTKLLNKRMPVEYGFDIKNQVIKALYRNATEAVLPELTKFLIGRRLFKEPRNQDLKIDAVGVLAKIGTVDAGILAGQVAQSNSGALAKAAEDVLIKIHGELT